MQLFGENGILNNASKAKISHEDESAKEELQLAWSARMSKFYEDVSSGKAKTSDIYKYFTEDELNTMLGNSGKIHALTYNANSSLFSISYVSSSGVPYVGEIKNSGEIVNLERAEGVITEVWVSYYASLETLTYASSKDIKINGQEPTEQWNISKMNDLHSVPWIKDTWIMEEGEEVINLSKMKKITNVQILDKIVPKSTDYLFSYLYECDNFEGMKNIDYSYCRKIGFLQFSDCYKLNNINIPSQVKIIDAGAFQNCGGLTRIELGNNIEKIGENAFAESGLTEVTIPENLKYIGGYSFYSCDNLKTVNYNAINAENISTLPCFDMVVENLIIGENVKKINERLFYFISIKTVRIPNSVEIIGDGAFSWNTNLTTVTGGENLKEIGDAAFYNCINLNSFNFEKNLEKIGNDAFLYTGLKEITLNQNIKSIGKSSFSNCYNLTTINYNAIDASESDFLNSNNTVTLPFKNTNENLIINIGSNVKVIPNYLFMASYAKKVNIEEGLEKIGHQAFYNCTKLEGITIPTTVIEIGRYSFNQCSNLTTINYNAIDASKSDFSYWDSEYRKNFSSITILGSK